MLSSACVQAAGAASGMLSARLLGPAWKGLVVEAVLWPGLLAAAGGGLGLEDAVVFLTARLPRRRGAVLGTSTVLGAVQAGLIVLAGWFILPGALGSGEPLADGRLYLAWVGVSYLTLAPMALLQGGASFAAFNALRPVVPAGVLAGLAVLWVGGSASPRAVLLVYLMANLVGLIAAWAAVLRTVRPSVEGALLRPLSGYALRSQATNLANLANDRIDLALLAILLAPAQLGLYAAGLSLSTVVRLLGSSVAVAVLPGLARMAGSPGIAGRHVARAVRGTLWLSLPAVLGLWWAVPAVFGLLGPGFEAGIPAARWLLIAGAAANVGRVLGAGLKAANCPGRASLAEAVGAALTVALVLGLTPRLGLTGAGLAAAASYAGGAACQAVVWARTAGAPLASLVVPDWRPDWLPRLLAHTAGRLGRVRNTPATDLM